MSSPTFAPALQNLNNTQLAEKDLLFRCLSLVAQKASPEEVLYWTDSDFIFLSEEIEQASGIIISKNTLKRLYGKMKTPEEYKPQKDTKNALAIYIGFSGWNEFKQSQVESNLILPEEEIGLQNEPIPNQQREKTYRKIFIFSLGFALLLSVFWWIIQKCEQNPFAKSKRLPDFSVYNPKDTIPFTMVINYNLNDFKDDSVKINKDYIYSNSNSLSTSQIEPTYSWLTMFKNNKAIKSIPYHAISRNWMALYQPKRKVSKIVLQENEYLSNGFAELKPDYFKGKNLDSLDFFFFLKHAKDFPISVDELDFEIKAKVPSPFGYCRGFDFKLVGENGQIEESLFPKGCGNHNNIFLPGAYYYGKNFNLSKLLIPTNQWMVLGIKTKNQKAQFFLDGKMIFQASYPHNAGNLKAINLRFNNRAKVDYIMIKNLAGKIIEFEEF